MLETLLAVTLAIQTNTDPHLPVSPSIPLTSIEQTNHLSNLITPEPILVAKPKKILVKTTPTPSASPRPRTSGTPAPAELDSHYNTYAAQYNVNKDTLTSIAMCESRHNPQALSKNQTYAGLYQFSASTWISTRNAMSADPNPELRFNAEEAIKTAAFKIASGGISAWTNCSRNS